MNWRCKSEIDGHTFCVILNHVHAQFVILRKRSEMINGNEVYRQSVGARIYFSHNLFIHRY